MDLNIMKKIVSEWLFHTIKKKEECLFIRTHKDEIISSDSFLESDIDLQKIKLNENRLFLSLLAQLGGDISKKIVKYLSSEMLPLSGVDHSYLKETLYNLLKNPKLKALLDNTILKPLNLGFTDYELIEADDKKSNELVTLHSKFDEKGNVIGKVLFKCKENESEGTKKILDLATPLLLSLNQPVFLYIDELDAKLHPLITRQLIKLYTDPKINKDAGQLFFATHDTNLLSSDLFRRDQIWFTEKDEVEQTDLYCLADMKLPDGSKVRNDSNLEKNYIKGRYGAIPYISND